MPIQYVDTIFAIENNASVIYTDNNAIVLAIKNILLTSKGNYPEHPDFGMDISKYQFEVLDDQTINEIETELSEQIARYIPSVNGVEVTVIKLDVDEGADYDGIGISVMTTANGEMQTSNFIALQDHEIISMAVETF